MGKNTQFFRTKWQILYSNDYFVIFNGKELAILYIYCEKNVFLSIKLFYNKLNVTFITKIIDSLMK